MMRLSLKSCLLAAAFPLAPCAAFAADYEPPLVVEQTPEYVPVEVGSGWYLRGDIGYDVNKPYGDADFGVAGVDDEQDRFPISGSIGFGYHFTDYLRADLNVGYLPGNRITASYDDGIATTASADIRNKAWYAMANAYVDLGTYAGITPYVGAGIGIYRSDYDLDATYADALGATAFGDSDIQYSLAYTLNAGLAYRVTPNLAIDLGYQFLAAPNAEYAKVDSVSSYSLGKGLKYHQVRLGLRYDLW